MLESFDIVEQDTDMAEAPERHRIQVLKNQEQTWYQTGMTRLIWLGGLLLLQSLSSVVLDANKELVQEHLAITLFLTMLVGAGGNAGAQASISVIRGIATGRIRKENQYSVLIKECCIGLFLAVTLFFVGFGRVIFSSTSFTGKSFTDALAVACALFCIVLLRYCLCKTLLF